jgi:dTDP-6-deoxy-L-talose 4-dehydrogenase (NAD+)
MKIALTGASGFIGRHLYNALANTPHDLVVLCRNSVPENVLEANNRTKIVKWDLSDNNGDIFERTGSPDMVIHLAWGTLGNFQSPAHMTEELPSHFSFLGGLIKSGLRRLMVAGTCFEYGLKNGEIDEDTPCQPATWYGLAKYSLLRQLEFLQREHRFELLWTRLFYLYGDGQPHNAIYPQLLRAIADGDREFPMSAGEQLRDYLPVEEVARLLAALTVSRSVGIVNVCSGQPVSMRKQVENWIAQKQSAIRPRLGHYPYRDFEPFAFWGANQRLQKYLGQ